MTTRRRRIAAAGLLVLVLGACTSSDGCVYIDGVLTGIQEELRDADRANDE